MMTGDLPDGDFYESSIGEDDKKKPSKKLKGTKTREDDNKWEKWQKVQDKNAKLNKQNSRVGQLKKLVYKSRSRVRCSAWRSDSCFLRSAICFSSCFLVVEMVMW
uniref:Uncharacterized protein n=1 Tax=Pseudo-nitzschia australis TaxID=44445 RepID=A0A7S4AW95_9STRA